MSSVLDFEGQVVIITGAGRGVGKAHALELAKRGARIVINDLGGATDGTSGGGTVAEEVAQEITDQGGEAIANADSVATPEGGKAIVAAALNNWGRLDAVITNAGILRDQSFAKLESDNLNAVLDVHLMGTFYVLQPAFQVMKESASGGRLLLTTSASGLFGNFGQSGYCAAKMGVVGLMRVLAIEGARYGIKANALAPVAATRLTAAADLGKGEPMAPASIAPIAAVLCHPDCPSTGEIFQAGGGWFARVALTMCEGWSTSTGELSAEALLNHWEEVRSGGEMIEPENAMQIADIMTKQLGLDELDFG